MRDRAPKVSWQREKHVGEAGFVASVMKRKRVGVMTMSEV